MIRFILILFILFPFVLNAESYNEALKHEAKGEYKLAIVEFKKYFDKNINDINQDGIIEKLLYSSTLLNTIDETLDYLKYYIKYMENPNSRFHVYKKIAEINELTGNIYDAGIYYEKAAYTIDDYMDHDSFFSSIEMLIELGYYELSIRKLKEVETDKIKSDQKNRFNLILSRLYRVIGQKNRAIEHARKVTVDDDKSNYYLYELGLLDKNKFKDGKSLEYFIIKYPYMKLKTPTDYIGLDSQLKVIPQISKVVEQEVEIFIGKYSKKSDAAGIINIINQLKLPWFFDTDDHGFSLYLFSKDRNKSISDLKKVGINVK